LANNDFVISADEKTAVQARCRCHPTLPPGTSRMMRVSHDYHRRGALAYLAAYDVHRAKVLGRSEDSTGIAAFTALVEQVMTQQPSATADRVFWVVAACRPTRRTASGPPDPTWVAQPAGAAWQPRGATGDSPPLRVFGAAEQDQPADEPHHDQIEQAGGH
jgi:hypothetical protein